MKHANSFASLLTLACMVLIAGACAPANPPIVAPATTLPALATATALPSDTPIPPTDTPIPTDTPTATLTPTVTPTDTSLPSPTATVTSSPTATPFPPTATRTATRKPTVKPTPTNTPAPVGCIMLLKSGGQGRVSIINNYAGALTLKIADKTYAIPGNTADFYIDVGPGTYVWTAVAPGLAAGMGPLVVMSGWNTVLACGKRS